MAGRPSKAQDQAKAAWHKSGGTLTVQELSRKYRLATSSIYRSKWWQERNPAQYGAVQQQSQGEQA